MTVIDKHGCLAVDSVLFLESIDEGLIFLKERVGIDPGNFLVKNKKRINDDYRQYFNKRTLDLFNQMFQLDVMTWGYSFEAGPGVPPENKKLTYSERLASVISSDLKG